jgi:nitroreductase
MRPITDVFRGFRYQRAIRTFTAEDVPDDLVHQVLTAAIHGPSDSNTQPWHFIVVCKPAVKRAISEVYEEAREQGSRGSHSRAHGRAGPGAKVGLTPSAVHGSAPQRGESARFLPLVHLISLDIF